MAVSKEVKRDFIIGSVGALLCAIGQALGYPEISKFIEAGQDVYDFIRVAALLVQGAGFAAVLTAATRLGIKYIPRVIDYGKKLVNKWRGKEEESNNVNAVENRPNHLKQDIAKMSKNESQSISNSAVKNSNKSAKHAVQSGMISKQDEYTI